jgi:hypothetical protein
MNLIILKLNFDLTASYGSKRSLEVESRLMDSSVIQ